MTAGGEAELEKLKALSLPAMWKSSTMKLHLLTPLTNQPFSLRILQEQATLVLVRFAETHASA